MDTLFLCLGFVLWPVHLLQSAAARAAYQGLDSVLALLFMGSQSIRTRMLGYPKVIS